VACVSVRVSPKTNKATVGFAAYLNSKVSNLRKRHYGWVLAIHCLSSRFVDERRNAGRELESEEEFPST